ncbi:hypothetical protein P9057_08480 [Gallibacterium anatis]|uniref:hypothetical protein n=1 Tax=Gallibacterium anatis TaxID=750 RepID=UPI003006FEC9
MKPFNPKGQYTVLTPEGTYKAHVQYAYERVSRNGNPYVSLGFRLADTNRVLFRNYFLDGDPESFAVQRSAEEFARVALVSGVDDLITDPKQLITGVQFNLTVSHYTDKHGVAQEEVRFS